MWAAMEAQRPTVFTSSNSEGVDRVTKGKGNYAFLMESTSIEYTIERNCDLTQVGGMLDSKGSCNNFLQPVLFTLFHPSIIESTFLSLIGYGIAMRQGSPYRTLISGAVLKLQEEGKLHVLKTRWWKEKRGGGSCRVTILSAKCPTFTK